MDGSKNLFASRGVWGGIIAVGAVVAGWAGVNIDPETQGVLTDRVLELVTVVGGFLAIIGRIWASKRIG